MIDDQDLFHRIGRGFFDLDIDLLVGELVPFFGEFAEFVVDPTGNGRVILVEDVLVEFEIIEEGVFLHGAFDEVLVPLLEFHDVFRDRLGFVPHLADEFLEDVLQGDDAGIATELVFDEGDVMVAPLHQREDRGNLQGDLYLL